ELQPLLGGELIDDRRQLLHELVLHFLLQLLHFGLRVLLEALAVFLLPLDLLLELRACRIVHHAAARLELLLVRLQLFGPLGDLVLLLSDQRLHAREARLALGGILERHFGLEERDFRAGRKRRGRLRRRRGDGWRGRGRLGGHRRGRLRRGRRGRRLRRRRLLRGGLRQRWSGDAQRQGQRRDNGRTFHPSESFRESEAVDSIVHLVIGSSGNCCPGAIPHSEG